MNVKRLSSRVNTLNHVGSILFKNSIRMFIVINDGDKLTGKAYKAPQTRVQFRGIGIKCLCRRVITQIICTGRVIACAFLNYKVTANESFTYYILTKPVSLS